MTNQTPSPEPHDAEPGDSVAEVRAREPAVGAATETPHPLAEHHAIRFAETWDGTVSAADVLAVLKLAAAGCRTAAILVPLFLSHDARRNAGREWHTRQILKASRRTFRVRNESFHESLAAELAEYIYALPDNGVTEREVADMLTELQANADTRNDAVG